MQSRRMTVADLIAELEGCDPDAEVRLAEQPAWAFEYTINSANAVVEVDLHGEPVVYLGEGQQLGYLPDEARREFCW